MTPLRIASGSTRRRPAMSAFSYPAGRAEVCETSASKNMEPSVLELASNGFAVEVPPKSVITVVIRDVKWRRD